MELLLLVPLILGAGTWVFRPSKFRLPRCIVCSHPLFSMLSGDSKVVACGKCRVLYNRSSVKESDPKSWELVRQRRMFSLSLRRDTGIQNLLPEYPLAKSKVPDA